MLRPGMPDEHCTDRIAASLSGLLGGCAQTEHPTDTELIRKHTEAATPECVVQWHCDLAVFAQRGEEPLHFRFGLTINTDGEIVALLEGDAWQYIRRHQNHRPARQFRMQDPIGGGFRDRGHFGRPGRKGSEVRIRL